MFIKTHSTCQVLIHLSIFIYFILSNSFSLMCFAAFLSFAVFSQCAKNGVRRFLMTYPLMHILCNVLVHIWKEANSRHKYLMRTFYIPTYHISINCRMYLWAHVSQLCYPPWKLFPSLHLHLLCFHKRNKEKKQATQSISEIVFHIHWPQKDSSGTPPSATWSALHRSRALTLNFWRRWDKW